MANWYGSCRTNYVRVKDVTEVLKIFAPFQLKMIEDGQGRIGFLSEDEYGGWPSSVDDEDGNEIEFDFSLIIPQLADKEVLIVMCAGAEKLRYITGEAIAYAWDGRSTAVYINDIYKKVEAEFGVVPTAAEY
jgi:hypothetical protein